jgi:hypothetical protein
MHEGVVVRLHVFLNLELCGDKKSAWWPSALPLGEVQQLLLWRRLVGSTAGLDVVGKRKFFASTAAVQFTIYYWIIKTQTDFVAQLASSSKLQGFFRGDKAARTWNWPLTSV